MKLKGVFTAIVTPFNGGHVDLKALHALVERQIDAGVDGIVPVGTTGESPTLTPAEHRAVIEAVVQSVNGRVTVIAGCGSNSTNEAIAMTEEAKKIGADASLQVAPYYNKPNQEGLYAHFHAIADAVDMPLVLYNIPGRSMVNISVETIVRLCAHRNIVAIKEASGNLQQIMDLIHRLPEHISVLSGEDALTYSLIALGGSGVISVASNLFPRDMCRIAHSALNNAYEEARAAHYRMLPFFHACFCDTNPIPIKYAMAQRGLIKKEYRLPLTPPSSEVMHNIDAALNRFAD